MKKLSYTLGAIVCFILVSCDQLQQVVNQFPSGEVSSSEMAAGLKQALEIGVGEGVDILNKKGGYFKDEAVKILLPEELRKVDEGLRKIGLSNLADEGLKVLNSAAEDAVSEAKPIFINTIKSFTFDDAKRILISQNDLEATQYLQEKTTMQLKEAFAPKIETSFSRVGADKIWAGIIGKYNSIPLVKPVNPNLTGYVTEKTIEGLFTKVGDKEKEIRNSVGARTTALLQKVFALQ